MTEIDWTQPTIVTLGHGTLGPDEYIELLAGAGIDAVVDIRAFPGSRRYPHFLRERMEAWLPARVPLHTATRTP